MIERSTWKSACALVLVLGLFSGGCGRSGQALAPSGSSGDATSVERDDAAPDHARDGNDEDARRATPISGPTVISKSGDYRLTDDIQVDAGDAIVISASHVRLWLGHHRLRGPGNKDGRALVIDGARDVIVRGGRIERFGIGAVLLNASHCRVRDLTIVGGDETADPPNGNPPQIGIMLVNSAMNRVEGNRMRDVNLGIFVRGGGSYENLIRGNAVVGGTHGLLAICYNPAPGTDPTGPTKDRVQGNYLTRFGTAIALSEGSSQNLFAMNTIRYFNAAYDDMNGTNVFVRNHTRQIQP